MCQETCDMQHMGGRLPFSQNFSSYGLGVKIGWWYPKLERRISFVRPSVHSFICHTQGTPPECRPATTPMSRSGYPPCILIKGKCRLATTPMSRSGYPPWILKRTGLESFGWRLISSIGKTKRIKKNWQKKYLTLL